MSASSPPNPNFGKAVLLLATLGLLLVVLMGLARVGGLEVAMSDEFVQKLFPTKAHLKLESLRLAAQGHLDGLEFAVSCGLELDVLQAEIAEVERHMIELANGPMKPGAHPRIYQDGYLTGLRAALTVITTANIEYVMNAQSKPELILAEHPDEKYRVTTDISTSEQ